MRKVIHDTFRALYSTLTDYERAYDNNTFDTTEGVLYLTEYLVQSRPVRLGVDFTADTSYKGFYQITVNAPKDGGMGDTDSAVAAIKAVFYDGRKLADNFYIISPPEDIPSIVEGTRYITVIRIYYELVA